MTSIKTRFGLPEEDTDRGTFDPATFADPDEITGRSRRSTADVRSRSYSALITGVLVASIAALTIGATAGAGVGTGAARGDRRESYAASRTLGRCTMAVPPLRATIAVETWNVADFCELLSQAFSGDVFHAPVLGTLGVLWHYPDAELSCRLRYQHTRARLMIYNSPAACRWLRRGAQGWDVERGTAHAPTA